MKNRPVEEWQAFERETRSRQERPVGGGDREGALDVVLGHVPGPAMICDQEGALWRANAAAELALAKDPASWRETISAAVRGARVPSGVTVSKLSAARENPYFLIVARADRDPVAAAIEGAREDWGLSGREVEVLAELAAGKSNRTIAEGMRLAERTVELHVTSLLRKAGVDSRAQLIIALWKLSEDRGPGGAAAGEGPEGSGDPQPGQGVSGCLGQPGA